MSHILFIFKPEFRGISVEKNNLVALRYYYTLLFLELVQLQYYYALATTTLILTTAAKASLCNFFKDFLSVVLQISSDTVYHNTLR